MTWLLVLTGCDVVLGLTTVHERTEVDASAAIDAPLPGCVADGSHDEDGDGFPDSCDLCPTISSGQMDRDGDGVGDECDPSTEPDKILAFYPMTMPNAGVMLTVAANQQADAVAINNSQLTTVMSFEEPERIVLAVDKFENASTVSGVALSVGAGNASMACNVSRCANGTAICLQAFYNLSSPPTVTATIAANQVKTIGIERVANGHLRCVLNGVTMTGEATGNPMSGPIKIYAPDGPIQLTSLIMYDSQP